MAKKQKPTTEAVTTIIPVERIERQIYLIRGQKVMLDSDLADLYQIETFNLNKAVKRNPDRFPDDFMFQLTQEEAGALRFQIGMSKVEGRGGRRYLPYAFTEHGVAMLASVLNSNRAVQMNILIVRAFIKLREILATNKDFAARLEKVEAAQERHASVITILAEEIDNLKQLPPELPKRPIGFVVNDTGKKE
jgi:phage regulator Rha-like protein